MSLGAFDGDCKGGVWVIWGVEVNNLRYLVRVAMVYGEK